MTGYKLDSVCISNFKFIEYGSLLEIDLSKNVTVLNGPNGYGKSTIFDAIELLITGHLKHFKEDLPNRGRETYRVLANKQSGDINLIGRFTNHSTTITIERNILCEEGFKTDRILIDGKICAQNDVYEILNISEVMFDLGTYISQSESLSFLKMKYGARKEKLSSIAIDGSINPQCDYIEKLHKKVCLQWEEQIRVKKDEHDKLLGAINENKQKLIDLDDILDTPVYEKLFCNKEYPFDAQTFDSAEQEYSVLVEPLVSLENFLVRYDDYISVLKNYNIDQLLTYDVNIYKALFFKKYVQNVAEGTTNLEFLGKVQSLLAQLENENYFVDVDLFSRAGISAEITAAATSLLQTQKMKQEHLGSEEKILSSLLEKRQGLIAGFQLAESVDRNSCPLCGRQSHDLLRLFNETEKILLNSQVDSFAQLSVLGSQIRSVFTKGVIPLLKKIVEDDSALIQAEKLFGSLVLCNTAPLELVLRNLGYTFPVANTEALNEEAAFANFTAAFDSFSSRLNAGRKSVSNGIDSQQIDFFKNLHQRFYDEEKPIHSVDDIKNKRLYISIQLNRSLSKSIDDKIIKCSVLKDDLDNENRAFEELHEDIVRLSKEYKNAKKEYETNLVDNIRIPVYIYTGKIVQNHPLGLGVRTEVRENQIVFYAKNPSFDIFNILSEGQLNGVIISILLSIKTVFCERNGLDLLLIDDPLQSIDDISAISLADLLSTQFPNTQMILSTHEENNANLLLSKFRLSGRSTKPINLKERYLEGSVASFV